MRWPWQTEKQDSSYTDALVNALVAQAGGAAAGDPSAIGALETAAGFWSRAFAAAIVTPAAPAITPAFLALVARDLIRRGESLHAIEVTENGLSLQAVGSWDIRGGPDESDWAYRLSRYGPSGTTTSYRPSDAVLHFRYAVDSARPHRGLSPLQWANRLGTLAGNVETRLGEELSGAVARLVPVPADGGDGEDSDPLKSLKADIGTAKGGALLVETTSGGWGDGRVAAPQADWGQKRIGPDPPATLGTIRNDAAASVMAACGVPASLTMANSDGTAQREAWRRFIMGSYEPVARMVALELSTKLDIPGLSFSFASLWAHDLAGRAKAFKDLVIGGQTVEAAAALSGVVSDE